MGTLPVGKRISVAAFIHTSRRCPHSCGRIIDFRRVGSSFATASCDKHTAVGQDHIPGVTRAKFIGAVTRQVLRAGL